MTAQPTGIRPSALRVATHGQQVASLGFFYPSAEVQSAYSTAPADKKTLFSILMFLVYQGTRSTYGLVSLFNGISTFLGYLVPKPFS